MPDAIQRGGAGDTAPPSTAAAGPSLTTSVYETRLGLVDLTWSHSVLGLSLRVDLHLVAAVGDGDEDEPLRFRVRPWLFWKRRGSKHFHLKDHPRHHSVDIAWDLGKASFPASGCPEPAAGFYVSVAVDGEMLVVAGDLADEACRNAKAKRPSAPFSKPVLISRREHVKLGEAGGRRYYTTRARFGGRERQISIELGGKEKERDSAMTVCVDGERALDVRRLRWKFRGSEKVEVKDAGGRIQISWDLHNWLFQLKSDATSDSGATSSGAVPPAAELGQAMFVFRFEPEEGKEEGGHSSEKLEGHFGKKSIYRDMSGGGYSGKYKIWSDSSSGGGRGIGERRRSRQRRGSLRKTSSSSSSTSSSASSAGSSTVMGWASPEEVELQRAEGFSLLVYAWKR